MRDDALRLRTIVVSTRAALAKSEDARAAGIRAHADELLQQLAERVAADGASAEMLSRIAAARAALDEDR